MGKQKIRTIAAGNGLRNPEFSEFPSERCTKLLNTNANKAYSKGVNALWFIKRARTRPVNPPINTAGTEPSVPAASIQGKNDTIKISGPLESIGKPGGGSRSCPDVIMPRKNEESGIRKRQTANNTN